MHWRQLATSIALGLLAAPAFAGPLCTSTTPLGSISAPNVADFAGSFDTAGQYVECFTFTPSIDIDGTIHVNDFDVGNNQLDIDLTRIELYNATELVASAPKQFDFGSLQPGVTYTLALYSDVSPSEGRLEERPGELQGPGRDADADRAQPGAGARRARAPWDGAGRRRWCTVAQARRRTGGGRCIERRVVSSHDLNDRRAASSGPFVR